MSPVTEPDAVEDTLRKMHQQAYRISADNYGTFSKVATDVLRLVDTVRMMRTWEVANEDAADAAVLSKLRGESR